MDIIEFQKRWIMRYINPIFFYLPFQSCQVNEIGFNIKVLLWNTYNPVKDEYKNRLTEEKGLLINRPCDYYKILITYFVAVHDCHKVFGIRKVYDVVGVAREHDYRLDLVP